VLFLALRIHPPSIGRGSQRGTILRQNSYSLGSAGVAGSGLGDSSLSFSQPTKTVANSATRPIAYTLDNSTANLPAYRSRAEAGARTGVSRCIRKQATISQWTALYMCAQPWFSVHLCLSSLTTSSSAESASGPGCVKTRRVL
jgi:hypothetical protein